MVKNEKNLTGTSYYMWWGSSKIAFLVFKLSVFHIAVSGNKWTIGSFLNIWSMLLNLSLYSGGHKWRRSLYCSDVQYAADIYASRAHLVSKILHPSIIN